MTDTPPLLSPSASAFSDPDDLALIVGYIESGAGDVPEQNVRDWQQWRLVPRAFADVTEADATTKVLGRAAVAPIIVAPTHGQLLLHDRGDIGAAAGAREAGVPFVLSQGAGVPIESIGGEYLQQVYLPVERSAIVPLPDRAVAGGAYAFVLTVDQPAAGGDPFRTDAGRVLSRLPSPNFSGVSPESLGMSRHVRPSDITWLAETWGLPVLVKGILDRDSAITAVDAGAAGVVVSNHGGRQLAGVISPALVLEEVADAVGHRALVWADSGIRTGVDVFRALALGADAVLVGRPVLRSLATGGDAGVATVLRDLVADLRSVMANVGASALADIDRTRVRAHAGAVRLLG